MDKKDYKNPIYYDKAAYYRDEIKKIKERIQAGDEVV